MGHWEENEAKRHAEYAAQRRRNEDNFSNEYELMRAFAKRIERDLYNSPDAQELLELAMAAKVTAELVAEGVRAVVRVEREAKARALDAK